MGFIQPSKIFINDTNCKQPNGLFINTYTGAGLAEHPHGQWSELDLSSVTSSIAIGVDLSGLLIITHGSNAETANLRLSFRNIGDSLPGSNYHGQVIETEIGGGQRSPYSTFVPLTAGKCEVYWEVTNIGGSYPDYSSYGINLSIQKYYE